MSVRIWNGSNGDYADPTRWNGSAPPQSGDTAEIPAGSVSVTHGLSIGSQTPSGSGVPGSLNIAMGGHAQFHLKSAAIEFAGSTFGVSGPATTAFVNDGTFSDFGGSADFAAPVTGSGTFDFERGKFLASHGVFENSVGSGTSVIVGASSTVALADPAHVAAAISLRPFAQLVLENTHATSSTYAGGTLHLSDGGKQVAALNISAPAGYNFAMSQAGANLVITSVLGPSALA